MADNAQLVLETLSSELPDKASKLLETNDVLKKKSLEYLNELFTNESILLNNDNNNDEDINGLVNEIAELDSAHRVLEDRLKKKVVSSSNDIIESRFQLNLILKEFSHNFDNNLTQINRSLENSLFDKNQLKILKNKNFEIETSSIKIHNNFNSINDILELPSLAGTCVKKGYYHETLEINSFIKRLLIRYPEIEIIKKIEKGIKYEIETMLIGLLKLLKTDLKQSNIIKIIAYLNRIYPFNNSINFKNQEEITNLLLNDELFEINSNSLLEIIYLQSRYQFIINELEILQPLKNHSIEKYLKRSIELIREHCFTSILTFQSIFNKSENQDELIKNFIEKIIKNLLNVLVKNLPLIKESQLKHSLILQIIYCSQSLGRIGGEFNNLILLELVYKNKIISINEWFLVLKKQRNLMKNLDDY